MSRITLSDIAIKAGVSVSAVSLALRNSSKVSQKRRKQVLQIATDLGYVQDPRVTELMQHLRSNRGHRKTATLGVIIPELKQSELHLFPTLKLMLGGIKAQANQMGFAVDTFILDELNTSVERIHGIIRARGIEGVVVLPYKHGVEQFRLDLHDFCAVTGGYSIVEPNLNRVVPDYLQMMDEMVENLIHLGHRRIGMIMTYRESEGGNGRKLFLSSFLFYQSMIMQEHIVPVLRNREATPEGLQKWLRSYNPDAIISSGHLYTKICSLGYRIPDDFSFVSIDLSESPQDLAGVDHRWDKVGL